MNFFINNRAVSGSLIIVIYLGIASVLAYIISGYIAKLYRGEKTWFSPVSDRIRGFFERILGDLTKINMSFRQYFGYLLLFNAAAGGIGFIMILYEGYLPHAGTIDPMSPSLTLNTIVSFLTNTNEQHYSDPLSFTFLTQSTVIIGLMFLSASTGFAASMAFIRGILNDDGKLGNFFHDFFTALFDLLLPLSILLTVVLVILNVPETTSRYLTVFPHYTSQPVNIPNGAVASLESIKNLGTNGGGFYGTNAGFPFENPSWMTNLLEFVSFLLIPLGSILSLGRVFESRKIGQVLFFSVMSILAFLSFFVFFAELAGTPGINSYLNFSGNMTGKETAIGLAQSSVFSVATTASSSGATDSLLVAYTPAGLLGVMTNLLMNDPIGGVGAGILNLFTYTIFTIFIVALMVGKLPELLSLRIGSKEIKYSTLSLLTHPMLILIPLGITLVFGPMSSFLNLRPDNLTNLLYEFSTSAANNGSEAGGFNTNLPYFNILDSVLMLLGRYLVMAFQLLIAQSFAVKKAKSVFGRTIGPDTFLFGVMLIAVMIILSLLSFFPILVLGPISSWSKDFSLMMGALHHV